MKIKATSEKEKGFVLSEILVSMVVLAIAAIGFLQIIQRTANRMHQTKMDFTKTSLAISLLESAIEESAYDEEPVEGVDKASKLNWRIQVLADKEYKSQSSEQPNIKIISVEVWKREDSKLKISSAKWVGR